jgi:predicted homoserine dehydrogenase-like protein
MAGDVVAMAKRALQCGETLDGEGGYTVYGKLAPVARSLSEGALPIGLAHGVRLTRDVAAGTMVRMSDVALDQGSVALKLRREMAGKIGITTATRLLG